MSVYLLLYEALEHLAAPAPEQLAWVEREKVSIDDLSLDYDNAAMAAWQLVESGELTHSQLDAVTSLLDDIVKLGNNEADWTRSALTASSKWAAIRVSAQAILAGLPPLKHDT